MHSYRPAELTRLGSLLDLTRQGYFVADGSGTVHVINSAAEKIFGCRREEAIGSTAFTLLPDRDGCNYLTCIESLINAEKPDGNEVRCETAGLRKNGEAFPVELVLNEIRFGGERRFIVMVTDISEHKLMVETLEASQRQLQQVIDLVPHMIFANDVKGQFVIANQAVAEAYGTTVEDLVQSTQQSLHPIESEFQSMSADDRRVLENGEPLFMPLERFTDVRGQYRFLQTYKIPLPYGVDEMATVLTVAVDVTDIRKTEEKLRLNNQHLEALIQNAPIAIAACQYQQGITVSNKLFQKLTGYTAEELTRLTMEDITHPDDWPESQQRAEHAMDGGVLHYNYQKRYIRKNAEEVQVEAYNTLIRGAPGSPDLLVGQVLDLTERLAREKELQESRDRLAYAGRLAQIGQMAAGIANEINQPLAAISTYSDIGRRYLREAKFDHLEELLDKLSKQALRAGAITETMQRLVSHHDLNLELEDCNSILDAVCKLAQGDVHFHGGVFQVSKAASLPLVRCDAIQIQQVILNLIAELLEPEPDNQHNEGVTIDLATGINREDVKITVSASAGRLTQAQAVAETLHADSDLNVRLSICVYIVNAYGGELQRSFHGNTWPMYTLTLPITGDKDD